MERQFVESLRRLYKDEKLTSEKVIELFQKGKITEEEKWYVLNACKEL